MTNKHQPCGKPGCINCWTPVSGFDGQATPHNLWNSPLTEDEKRLREFMLDQSRRAQNCAPGSPLYDRLMGTQGHVARHAVDQASLNKRYSELADAAEKIKGKGAAPGMFDDFNREFSKYILRKSVYLLILMLAVGVGMAVFL